MEQARIGVVGLGVMGRNLALNMESKGFAVSAYDAWPESVARMADASKGGNIAAFTDLGRFLQSLEAPRKIFMMVKAGEVTDRTIEALLPFLDRGDLLNDGGNSFYKDTQRRFERLRGQGILFLGTGVSGGEEGALHGPAIMPGGEEKAYRLFEPVFCAIAAMAEGEPCCTYIGPGGAGHFVKMVHNGIEYADMQIICEAYSLLKNLCGFSNERIGEIFSEWNQGELESYLIGITAEILKKRDPETGRDMVDVILDKAGQKGTGKWTSEAALDFGVSVPTITESVFARYISCEKAERQNAARIFKKTEAIGALETETFVGTVKNALYTAKIFSYAQGFALMKTVSDLNGWALRLDRIAAIFRGGCIIRAQFLNKITKAYERSPQLQNLMLDDSFSAIIVQHEKALRTVVQKAVGAGVPVPALASAVSYFDAYASETLPTSLLQAQRDYFGAHTFERVDRPGTFHFDWMNG